MTSFLQHLRPTGHGRHRATPKQERAARSATNMVGRFAYVDGAYVYVYEAEHREEPAGDGPREQS